MAAKWTKLPFCELSYGSYQKRLLVPKNDNTSKPRAAVREPFFSRSDVNLSFGIRGLIGGKLDPKEHHLATNLPKAVLIDRRKAAVH